MIYFITNCPKTLNYYSTKIFADIKVIPEHIGLYLFKRFLRTNKIVGFDKETTGLDAHMHTTLLDIFGNEHLQFVWHTPHVSANLIIGEIQKNDYRLLGHNIGFDLSFLITQHKYYHKKVYDTMIAEQRLYMKKGLANSLEALLIRYLNEYPVVADKNIRMEFVGVNPSTFVPLEKHIRYAAHDVSCLFHIKRQQELVIEQYNMKFLLYGIEFPLISVVVKAEVTGIDFDLDKWLEIANTNKKARYEVELKLDNEFKKLREETFKTDKNNINRLYISGGKWDNLRKDNPLNDLFNEDGTTNVLDLFGESMSLKQLTNKKSKFNKNSNNINYSSETDICIIFGRLGEPLLVKGTNQLSTASFLKNGKINRSVSLQTNANAFTLYLNLLVNTRMKTFIKLLLQYRGFDTAINNFGYKYKTKINLITGKLHTSFRTCSTDTGRMSSGGGTKQPMKPNFQNIPSRASYAVAMRNCFLAGKDNSIGTHDYSGAELIVMCSLAQDMKLLQLSKGDMHSYFAQLCWRTVFKYRAWRLIEQHDALRVQNGISFRDEIMIKNINDNLNKFKTFIVSSDENPKFRVDFKPETFGVIYGMHAKKSTQTLKLNDEYEGQLVIDTIEKEIPDTFVMVKAASAKAKQQGYLVLNERTNSRAWFPTILEVKENPSEMRYYFAMYNAEVNEARNIRIQGTQADAIKEAIVELQNWIELNNYQNEIVILIVVHDEIVDKHPKYLDGKSKEWDKWQIINNLQWTDTFTNKEYTFNNFPDMKKCIMEKVFDRYLENVTINVNYDVCPYWTK
jgi:DNA polymerase I-like protein with 3'-5' exonuclease and polymerase domains